MGLTVWGVFVCVLCLVQLGGGSGCTDTQPWRGGFCEGRVSQRSVQASCGGLLLWWAHTHTHATILIGEGESEQRPVRLAVDCTARIV